MKKGIFETPPNEIKCFMSIKESNFSNKKMGQNNHICLRLGLRGLKIQFGDPSQCHRSVSVSKNQISMKKWGEKSHLLMIGAEGAELLPPPFWSA